ncbi:MAG: ESX secretion-associated protein EspG [Rhodococcus sp. (in: high G+C Gram-positive bacteria)]
MTAWDLTSLEFSVLLNNLGRDRVPFPFSWWAPVRTADELGVARRDAENRVADDSLADSVGLLHDQGGLHVTVCGTDASDRRVRVRAAMSADGARAVVVHQDPGPSPDRGGAIHVAAVTARAVAATIAAALPLGKPGALPASSVGRAELLAGPDSYLHGSAGDDDRHRVSSVLNGSRDGLGEVVLGRAVDVDGPLNVLEGWRWVDVVGDGRYLLTASDVVGIEPATPAAMTSALVDAITQVRRHAGSARSDPAATRGVVRPVSRVHR